MDTCRYRYNGAKTGRNGDDCATESAEIGKGRPNHTFHVDADRIERWNMSRVLVRWIMEKCTGKLVKSSFF